MLLAWEVPVELGALGALVLLAWEVPVELGALGALVLLAWEVPVVVELGPRQP